MIYGNIEGVKNSILEKLEAIYDMKVNKQEIVTNELVGLLCEVTSILRREVSIAIDRKGQIKNIAIGDSSTVEIPLIDINEKRLSAIRIIHTHPNGYSNLSALDVSALIKLKLDCVVAIGVKEGSFTEASIGFCSVDNSALVDESFGPLGLDELLNYDFISKVKDVEESIKNNEVYEDNEEKAILVGVENQESLKELEELADACNIKTVEKVLQRRAKIDSGFYIGKGKVEEIAQIRQATRANIIIFDDELSSSQVRNLEEIVGVKVVDRTTLILEIFARRAKSKEAKIQVELAQLKYRLPRLSGMGTVLSRTGGGIGTKGPGEKKLETDRRHIKERIYDLLSELEKVKKVRETQREKRNKEDIPKISIVGYTNAGKSTLRNKLCDIAAQKDMLNKEKVFEADMLFATLDVTTRAINLPDNRLVTITDTVGFVRKLPHDLVEAFKSTLEEVVYSDLLLHVVDAASPYARQQIEAVDYVLTELKAIDKPIIMLLNKVDKATEEDLTELKGHFNNYDVLEISAKNSINLDLLLNKISDTLPQTLKNAEYLIPYTHQAVVAFLHRNAKIDIEDFREEGTYIKALVDNEVHNKCKEFLMV